LPRLRTRHGSTRSRQSKNDITGICDFATEISVAISVEISVVVGVAVAGVVAGVVGVGVAVGVVLGGEGAVVVGVGFVVGVGVAVGVGDKMILPGYMTSRARSGAR
jgi:hypothetical protein